MRRVRRLVVMAVCLRALSLAYADPLNAVAKHLAKGLAILPSHNIAVLPFEYPNGAFSSGSMLVAERLTTCLAQRPHVQVIERTLLPGMLEEMKMEASGVMPSTATLAWGKILAVDALVMGTLVDLGNSQTEMHARVVALETGAVLAAETITIHRTWADLPLVPPALTPETVSATDGEMPGIDHLIRDPVLPPDILRTVRAVYDTSQDPRVRAGALYGMGIIFERQRMPLEAAQAYRRLIREFPENARLNSDASGRLWATRQAP